MAGILTSLKVTRIEAAKLDGILGLASEAPDNERRHRLAEKGYVPLPLLAAPRPDASGKVKILKVVESGPAPHIAPDEENDVRITHNAMYVAHGAGMPTAEQSEAVVNMMKDVGGQGAYARLLVGAHVDHYAERDPQSPVDMVIAHMSASATLRLMRGFYAAALHNKTLFDTAFQRLERTLNASGIPSLTIRGRLLEPNRIIVPAARAIPQIRALDQLDPKMRDLVEWMATKDEVSEGEFRTRARMLGIDPADASKRIAAWAAGERN